MKMKPTLKFLLHSFVAAAALAAFAPAAEAHRAWLLPSATVLSGEDPWVTVDAAISNDLFYFEHHAMRLDDLLVTAPDGSKVEVKNASKGRYRSTFDVHLTQKGTYRIGVVSGGLFARYEVDDKRKRWRGTAEALAKEIPANARNLKVTSSHRRMEVFVTAGAPTRDIFEPRNEGLEMVPVTHPNDLYAGETGTFKLLIDGEPAAGIEVSVIPGGIRYRDQLKEMKIRTEADGSFKVTWPEPGMYWLNASVRDDKPRVEQASERRAGYTATLEVLPQ